MNPNDAFGQFIAPQTIRFERLLPGPIERVWAYLTESEKRRQWLASGKMELHPGGRVELIFNHEHLTPHKEEIPDKYKEFGQESRMYGEITEIDPPHRLSYTWGEEYGVSEVTFELTPKDERVLLVLTHRRLGDDPEMLKGLAAGWHTHLGILNNKLSGQTPQPFWKVHMDLEEQYARQIASA